MNCGAGGAALIIPADVVGGWESCGGDTVTGTSPHPAGGHSPVAPLSPCRGGRGGRESNAKRTAGSSSSWPRGLLSLASIPSTSSYMSALQPPDNTQAPVTFTPSHPPRPCVCVCVCARCDNVCVAVLFYMSNSGGDILTTGFHVSFRQWRIKDFIRGHTLHRGANYMANILDSLIQKGAHLKG